MTERVIRHDENGLCTLTLNRPEKLNALDTQAFEELNGHLAALEAQTEWIGCVVLRGAGRGFCAGADLKAMGTVPVPPTFKPSVVERLGRLPQPVIAAIHGVCFTGDSNLRSLATLSWPMRPQGLPIPTANGAWSARGACRNACRGKSAFQQPNA